MRRGGAVERSFKPGVELVHSGFVGTRHALRRHHASVQLPQNFFPGFCVIRDAVEVERVEREAGGFQALIVAGDAILVEDGTRLGA